MVCPGEPEESAVQPCIRLVTADSCLADQDIPAVMEPDSSLPSLHLKFSMICIFTVYFSNIDSSSVLLSFPWSP